MIRLNKLLDKLKYKSNQLNLDAKINAVQFDSRKLSKSDLFVAQKGLALDGHEYINVAIEKGAIAIVCEELPSEIIEGISYIIVEDSSLALARISSNYYGNPSSEIKIVGVTGTNGKTTIASLLYKLFKLAGYKVGLFSTVVNYIDNKEVKATHTTPDVLQINALLSDMLDSGCEYCFMEVSSHALDQNRVADIDFDGALFTNITHDHLDYHKTFAEYIRVKKKFFDNLSKGSFAVTNLDDKNGLTILQNTKANKHSYSIRGMADYKARIIERHFSGMLMEINGKEMWTSLIGDYNASNLLAVYSTAILLGLHEDETLRYMSLLKSVPGRLDTLISSDGKMGIVDYAHTPDALKNVLENISGLKHIGQSVITVVGAGGDRDKSKRTEMASIAASYSDRLILTSDNPRSEDPVLIIEDMKAGLSNDELSKTISIVDRKEAIRTAAMLALEGDIILIAGKGHENYQEINGKRTHFDDKEIIREIFKK
jgi:UDP-N-acetylmuramoyl-L-alanyl-D-glutamate--2,6-diaminopimelate ligase